MKKQIAIDVEVTDDKMETLNAKIILFQELLELVGIEVLTPVDIAVIDIELEEK